MPNPDREMVMKLTPRQKQVLMYVSKGYTAKEVARLMGIGKCTVNDHLKAIYSRLDVCTKTEAAVLAAKARLV